MLAISPMLKSLAAALKKKFALPFPVLSDHGSHVAEKFGLVYTLSEAVQPIFSHSGVDLAQKNGDSSWRLPLPATYIINSNGKVVFRFVDTDYTYRLDPKKITEHLQQL